MPASPFAACWPGVAELGDRAPASNGPTARASIGAELPERLAGATASMSVEYVSAADGVDLDVAATLLRRGRSLCSVEAEARTPDGALVAKALVTYKLG